MSFSSKIIEWYHQHKRDLPWRNTQDPYQIWLSEIILQQTQVKQGLPYYERFLQQFPNVQALAAAHEEEVLRLWQGLGYYSRARNLHYTARYITQELDGKFPDNYKDLLKLKGVGQYTAAAIASFAYDEPVAVLDGNVYRVLARYFGIEDNIAEPKTAAIFRKIAQDNLPPTQAADYNQALMEFGAIHCRPAKPDCMFCPLQSKCAALLTGRVKELPFKQKHLKVKERQIHYLVLQKADKLALKQRTKKGIWTNLYDFYAQESDMAQDFESIIESSDLDLQNLELLQASEIYKHVLTHQRIEAKFWRVRWQGNPSNLPQNLNWYNKKEIEQLPKPILIEKYLRKHFF